MTNLECFTVKQVKNILQTSQGQTYALFAGEVDKSFPSFRIGTSWRVKRLDFESWLEKKTKAKK
ncbi:MAG: hypothetical protein K0S71_601 [Clostridia bacterium]|jgi:hypothetical protein|nr:hypothetical protein [Clostridia bacterium]